MRCFLAIELPTRIHDSLAMLQQELSELDRDVRWVKPAQIHLTLKFLGDVPDSDVPPLCQAVREVAASCDPFELHVANVGCFPPHGGARVVWAGLSEIVEPLRRCHQAFEAMFAEHGFPPEKRAFHPHLTIGRSRNRRGSRSIRSTLDRITDFDAEDLPVDSVVLMQSELSRQGPTYTPLVNAPLGTS